jgi:aspartyl-tRNA(Asn)/glutamyl-tRNA(Gln) amidotransferase subunit B
MYRPTIGLEVHAELATSTKMFCTSRNDPDETRPNVNICPVCTAHPGTLPVINREAVRHILRIGTAVGGTLATYSEFDRKSYFYPDIPKGYQISQYAHPLVRGGSLAGVALTRVHLEEDTARSSHEGEKSLVDFNRAGIPLMELVTEPVIRDAKTAGRFARELQLLLRTLGAGEANLEKGEMRIEANISVSNEEGVFGTKVEIKNLNSFRSVERAIEYETLRQIKCLEAGEALVQETRGWDEAKQVTFHQRTKEGSADYRYFPEPDLPKLYVEEVPEFSRETLLASLPELPWQRRARYTDSYGLLEHAAEYLVSSLSRADFFDTVAASLTEKESVQLAANYITTDLAALASTQDTPLTIEPTAFAELIRMVRGGELSSRGAKDTLALLVEKGGDPRELARVHGLIQEHDTGVLSRVVETVIKAEEKAVEEYRAGKQAALQFLLGKAIQESKGAGNPKTLRELLIEKLG